MVTQNNPFSILLSLGFGNPAAALRAFRLNDLPKAVLDRYDLECDTEWQLLQLLALDSVYELMQALEGQVPGGLAGLDHESKMLCIQVEERLTHRYLVRNTDITIVPLPLEDTSERGPAAWGGWPTGMWVRCLAERIRTRTQTVSLEELVSICVGIPAPRAPINLAIGDETGNKLWVSCRPHGKMVFHEDLRIIPSESPRPTNRLVSVTI